MAKNKNRERKDKVIPEKKHTEQSPKIPWLIIFSVLAVILLFLLFDPRMSMGGDNCHYMSVAQSILHKSYARIAFIGSPPEIATPGFPLIMAISLAVFGRTFVPMKIFSFLCFFLSLIFWWKLFKRQGIDKRLSIVILAFCIFNPLIAEFSYWELTEASFMLISSIAILYYFIILQKEKTWHWLILAVISTGSYYIRPAGIIVPIAIGLTLLVQRRWKALAIFSILSALLIVPWSIYFTTASKHMGGGNYLPKFFSNETTGELLSMGGFISKIFKNFSRYLFVNLPTMFLPIAQDKFANTSGTGILIGLGFLFTIVTGIIYSIRSKHILFSIYVVLTVIMLISFSEMAVLVRYLVVIYPFIVILGILGLEKILSRFKQKRAYVFGLFLIITLLSLPKYINSARENSLVRSEYTKGNKYAGYEPNLLNFIEANEWLKKYDTTANGVISRKPTLTWWFSGHPAQGYIWKSDVNLVKANIDSLGAKYVIVDQISSSTPQFLIPTIRAFPESFKVIYATKRPETYVLEIVKADSSAILNQ